MYDYDSYDPEYGDYDDDDYQEEQPPQHKFQFDMSAWEEWLADTIQNIVEEETNVWIFGHNIKNDSPVTDSLPKGMSNEAMFAYLGSNPTDQTLWKKDLFVQNKLAQRYINYLQANSKYILQEPEYYKGLFDNLN